MFMNGRQNFTGICKNQIWQPNMGYLRDHRCERKHMAYKCKIFETVNLKLHGHYTQVWTVSQAIGINTENKIFLSNKEYINGHWWYRINMATKCIVHMHITADLKAYLPTNFTGICSNVWPKDYIIRSHDQKVMLHYILIIFTQGMQ